MVKKLAKFLGYSLFFLMALLYFSPKVSIYYFLERELAAHAIVISSKEVLDSGFALNLQHAKLSLKTIETATISEINLKIFALYNKLECRDIRLAGAAQSFIPLHVESASLRYGVLDPLHVRAKIKGDFGEAYVEFHLLTQALHVEMIPSDLMLQEYKHTLANMSKNQNGEYIYDKTL